jgi:hypothetical protein
MEPLAKRFEIKVGCGDDGEWTSIRITEALSRLVTTLDVIGLEAFVPDPLRAPGKNC